ncbi:MAG: MmgE/PrpD family protein [Deltaproteobacteria bacterium]|nr:MmgE/PrpD family protein [Deltaproteobacteria bacterium]
MIDSAPKHFTPQLDLQIGEGLTQEVAQFIVSLKYDHIPPEVVELGKKSILDGFGLALAGSIAESGDKVQKYLRQVAGPGEAIVIGTPIKTSSRFAAFANGVGIHADDYDDTQLAVSEDRVYGLLTHPTAPCLPAAFSEAQTRGRNGRDFMSAYLIGVDVECKIAEAISPRHYQHGFHSTATCGPFAAASAAARLRNFDHETMQRALSIAGSQSGGLRENFGTMTKPFHAGRAAESGVVACDLAELGWTATDKILEAARGFFQAHGGGYDIHAIRGKLGSPWSFANPGVSIKPHPSGSLTHPGMTKMLELIAAHGIKAEDVKKVDVGTNHNQLNALIHHRPEDELQAKFSMEFCMAILLLDGRANLPEFTDETVRRTDVKEMIERINFHIHPEAEAAGYAKMTTIIDVHLQDGRTISGQADFGKGSPANPLSYDEVAEKFRGCAEFAHWRKDKTEKIISLITIVDSLTDLSELTSALCV